MRCPSLLRGVSLAAAFSIAVASSAPAQVPWRLRPPGTAIKNPPFPREGREFLALVCRRILGREPLPEEEARWLGRLEKEKGSREKLVFELYASDEFFVRRLFLDLLGREPTAGELRARTGHLAAGGRRVEVLQNLLESSQYRDTLR